MLKNILSRGSGVNLKEGRGGLSSACRCVLGEPPPPKELPGMGLGNDIYVTELLSDIWRV